MRTSPAPGSSTPRTRLVAVSLGLILALAATVLAVVLLWTPAEQPATPTDQATAPTATDTDAEIAASESTAAPTPDGTEPEGTDPEPRPTATPRPADTAEPVDPEGRSPDSPEPAATLHAAVVEIVDDVLVASFELGGPPPEETAAMLLWSVDLVRDREQVATITAQQDGARFLVGVYDWESGEQARHPDALTIVGTELVLRIPLSDLPSLDGVAWAASTHLDGAWSARVPGDAHDPDAPFEPLAD